MSGNEVKVIRYVRMRDPWGREEAREREYPERKKDVLPFLISLI
jgi:hypothetical protein